VSASERWRRKKDGESDSKEGNRQQVTELTELANRLLTRTGNMNVYQESYEHITKVVGIALPLLGGGISVLVTIYPIICQQGGFFENLGSVMFLTFHVLRGKCHVSTLDVLFLWIALRENQCVTGLWLSRKAEMCQ